MRWQKNTKPKERRAGKNRKTPFYSNSVSFRKPLVENLYALARMVDEPRVREVVSRAAQVAKRKEKAKEDYPFFYSEKVNGCEVSVEADKDRAAVTYPLLDLFTGPSDVKVEYRRGEERDKAPSLKKPIWGF